MQESVRRVDSHVFKPEAPFELTFTSFNRLVSICPIRSKTLNIDFGHQKLYYIS